MRDKWNNFLAGIAQNAAWDFISSIFRLLFKLWPLLVSGGLFVGGWDFLGLVPMFGYLIAFLGYGFMVIGFIATAWVVAGRISKASDLLESDVPNLICEHEWNQIINHEEKKIAIAVIAVKNKPGRRTDNSTAYQVSARLDFFDRKDRILAQVRCGYWSRDSAQNYFSEMGKKKKCEKIVFYTHDSWNLPIAYQVEGSDIIYAYDQAAPIESKKIGKLPVKLSIVFEGENFKATQPTKYLLVPDTTGTQPAGIWPQKKI